MTTEELIQFTPEQKRIRIAGLLYKQVHPANKDYAHPRVWSKEHDGMIIVPDYLNDLNACHEMEKVLEHKHYSQFTEYRLHLQELCEEPICATATQRCDAFLLTI